jgi:WXG100 family type VII secretion target
MAGTVSKDDGVVHVNYSHVTDVGDALAAGTYAINTLIKDLEEDLDPLRQTFDGQTREMYDIKKRAWDNAATDMTKILDSATKTLDDMAHNYSHTDTNLAFQWSELR